MNFFYLLNDSSNFVVYCHTKTNSELEYHINLFLKNKKNKNILTILYSSDECKLNFENRFIRLQYISLNFEQTLLRHNFCKDRLANSFHKKEQFLSLYNSFALSPEQIHQLLLDSGRTPNNNIKRGIEITKKETFKLYNLDPLDDFSLSLTDFITCIKANLSVCSSFNFKNFFNLYSIPTDNRLFDRAFYKTVLFENVYYRNKGFYQEDGSFFDITEIKKDIEYCNYNKTHSKIDKINAIHVTEPVLFLDYIYDFYNFGEFWDIVKRLMFFNKQEPVELYGLKENRILNIKDYFSAFNISYPPKYCRDYKTKDELTETNNGSTFYFKKLYLSTLNNTCRSSLDPWILFEMNSIFNKNESNGQDYCLYLSRGKMKRGLTNEQELLNVLTKVANFKILNGDESFEEQQYYFTNAKLIFGVHGALQGNFIWNKNNFVFVELTPYQRCLQLSHFSDSYDCGFKSIIIPCNADKEEMIILTSDNINQIIDIIKLLG